MPHANARRDSAAGMRSPAGFVPAGPVGRLITRSPVAIALTVGLLIFTLGRTAGAAGDPSAATRISKTHVTTQWLLNGLRLVLVTGPWQSDRVFIRLIVRGGFLTGTQEERSAAHFLEHLVFRHAPGLGDLLIVGDFRGVYSGAAVAQDHERHAFDVDAERARTVLDAILHEFDRQDFKRDELERERSRVLHEGAWRGFQSPLSNLAAEFPRDGAFRFSTEMEMAYVDTVSPTALREMFARRYVANRMTLVVAGDPGVVDDLRSTLDAFEKIPARTGDAPPESDDIPKWLAGKIGTRSLSVAGAAGIHFRNPDGTPSPIRSLVRDALVDRIYDELEWPRSWPIPILYEVRYTPAAESWLLLVNGRTRAVRLDAFSETVLRALANLAHPDSGAWWNAYLERTRERRQLLAHRRLEILDLIVSDLARSAQGEAAPQWDAYLTLPPAERVRESCREIFQKGVTFQTYLDRRRVDWHAWGVSSPKDESYDVAGFILHHADTEEIWWIVALLVILSGGVAAIRVLAARAAREIERRLGVRGIGPPRPGARGAVRKGISLGGLGFFLAAATVLSFMGAAQAAPLDPRVLTLDNGLRVVLCPVERSEPVAAVRWVIQSPQVPEGSLEWGVFNVAVRSLFLGASEDDDLYEYLDVRSSIWRIDIAPETAVLAFDIRPARLDSLFARIGRQWGHTGITESQFDMGRELAGELGLFAGGHLLPEILNQPVKTPSHWNWWDISFGDVRSLFCEQMVARRMAVVIAGDESVLERAASLALLLEAIPPGAAAEPVWTDYHASLPARLDWSEDHPWVMGFVVDDSEDTGPVSADFLGYAFVYKIQQSLAYELGMAYDLDAEAFSSANEHVMVLRPYVDERRTEPDQVWRHVHLLGAELADSSSAGWWRDFVNAWDRFDQQVASASKTAVERADYVASRLDLGAENTEDFISRDYPVEPEEVRRQYAALLERTKFFVVEPRGEGFRERLSGWFAKGIVILWRDLFGPDDRNRTIALMCQTVLILLVLRGFDGTGREPRGRVKKDEITPGS